VSETWRIEPEPTEEELTALMTAITAMLQSLPAPEPESEPPSRWLRTARREAINSHADMDRGWDSR
jgi:hypothetical protein